MSFDKIVDLTDGVYFYYYNNIILRSIQSINHHYTHDYPLPVDYERKKRLFNIKTYQISNDQIKHVHPFTTLIKRRTENI